MLTLIILEVHQLQTPRKEHPPSLPALLCLYFFPTQSFPRACTSTRKPSTTPHPHLSTLVNERDSLLFSLTHDVNPDTPWRVLLNLLIEPRLNRLDNRLIPLTAHKAHRQTLGSEPACTTHTVQVSVGRLLEGGLVRAAGISRRVRHIVVDGDVDTLNVDAAAEDVGADADTVLEVLEVLVALNAVRSVGCQCMFIETSPKNDGMDGRLTARPA